MKILANNGISKDGEIALQNAGFEVIIVKVAQEQLENYINSNNIDAILVDHTTQIRQELIDECPSLKLIGSYSINMDMIDVEYAKNQGLYVINASEAASNSIAELVFAHLFGMVRFLHQSNREMPLEGDSNFNGLKKMYTGTELRGKTLGLIGMNSTAIATAKIALGIGMNVVFTDNKPRTVSIPLDFFDGQGVEFAFHAISLEEILKQSDFISLHINTQDNYVIGTNEFEKMKDGIGIINTANGSLIDEVALVQALKSGKLKYAALDVFKNEPQPEIQLLMHPDLSLSPNIGSLTQEAKNRVGFELANQIINLLTE